MGAVETLAGVATGGEGGGRAGSSYELDAAQSIQSKLFSPYFGPSGRLLMEGIRAFQIVFLLLVMKKTHTMTFLQGDCLKQNNS
jgi:hypothetical protein